jgi:hypothetical protein
VRKCRRRFPRRSRRRGSSGSRRPPRCSSSGRRNRIRSPAACRSFRCRRPTASWEGTAALFMKEGDCKTLAAGMMLKIPLKTGHFPTSLSGLSHFHAQILCRKQEFSGWIKKSSVSEVGGGPSHPSFENIIRNIYANRVNGFESRKHGHFSHGSAKEVPATRVKSG